MPAALVSGATGAVGDAWDGLLTGITLVADTGRTATEGIREGLDQVRTGLDAVTDALNKFPPWMTVPVRVVGRVLTWSVHFVRACVFLWATLYLSIVLWLGLGLLMYPALALERSPDTTVAIVDVVVDVVRVVYNVLAAAWNLTVDLARPLIPLWNLFADFVARCFLFVLDTVGTLVGAIGDVVHPTATTQAAGFNLDGYLNVMVPAVLFLARIGWILMDIAFMFADIVVQFMLRILIHIVDTIVALVKLITCCQVDGGCCFLEFLQIVLDHFVFAWNNVVQLLLDFELFGAHPLSFLDFLLVPEGSLRVACEAGDMALQGDQCKCADAFQFVPPCQPCTMRCAEDVHGINWIKECPGSTLPVEIIEAGWCSVAPPEGKGPRPTVHDDATTLAVRTRAFHVAMSAHVEESCYYTCFDHQRYRRCAPDYAFDATRTYGACDGALIETDWTTRPGPRPEGGRHAARRPTFHRTWTDAVDATLNDVDPACAAVVTRLNGTVPTSYEDIAHFETCVVQHGWHVPSRLRHHVSNQYLDTWPRRARAWAAPWTAALYHPRLSATLQAVHAVVHSTAFHVRRAWFDDVDDDAPSFLHRVDHAQVDTVAHVDDWLLFQDRWTGAEADLF